LGLTVEGISSAKPKKKGDRWLTDSTRERNAGRLTLRISPTGVKRFYFRYAVSGSRTPVSLGVFARDPKAGFLTLEQARAKARELSSIHKHEARDVKAHLAKVAQATERAEAAERERVEREQAQVEAARVYNLRALAAEYVTSLEQRGKTRAAYDARNIFKNHLDKKPLADTPAKDVERREVTALLRELVEAGKRRTAGKLRSYLRAAYATALHAEGDATAPAAMIAFNVNTNPVADTKSLAHLAQPGQRTLSAKELWRYWQRLSRIQSEPIRAALQAALLLGGQRIQQLLRLTRADLDLASGFLVLRDPKGRRTQPRIHELPIPKQAMPVLAALVERAEALESPWVFTSDGKVAVDHGTLTVAVTGISKAMVKAKESAEPFRLRDLRRTAETMLAQMGVSQDLRAQIQSHGLGGVQTRHYDRHDYRLEKRKTLAAWARKVTTEPKEASVRQLASSKRSNTRETRSKL
jgi:integrase